MKTAPLGHPGYNAPMSEDPTETPNGSAAPAEQPSTRRLRLEQDEQALARSYANAFRSFTSGEEVVVDFGFNLVRLDGQQRAEDGADGTVQLEWNQRTVLSYRTAKRLAIDLGRIIRDFERSNGEIPVQGGGGGGGGNPDREPDAAPGGGDR